MNGTRKSIWISIDDEGLTQAIQTILAQEDFNIKIVEDENHLQTELKTTKPDLLLLDIHFFENNGVCMLKELKKNRPTSDIPVMVLSEELDRKVCSRLEVDECLAKPFDIELFLRKVNDLTQSSN